MPVAVVILAAGHGSRMNSGLPKVLHEVAHAPLLVHAMDCARSISAERIVIVTGYASERVGAVARKHEPDAKIIVQDEQLGTAHAVAQAQSTLADFEGDVIVLYADTPFISAHTVQQMLDARKAGANIVVLGFESPTPNTYGRLILAKDGGLEAIIETKDASQSERRITLCNSGVVCADQAVLFDLVGRVENNNASGEYYLTDIVGLARTQGLKCAAITCDRTETLGVNSPSDLARAQAAFQIRARARALDNGVTLHAPETVHFAYDTLIGPDVIIEPNVVFAANVTVESGVVIRAFSHLEDCHIGPGAIIGPYARLRPGAKIGQNARIGNFVEIKAATVGQGAKIGHLSYVGDADIGDGANIGAGTITCNYDSAFKHTTTIGARAFIGSNTALVAPVRIGTDAMTGAGSVITQDVPDTDLAISRTRQVNKPGLALRLITRLRAAKAAKNTDT